MKQVVSISLGSSSQDFDFTTEFLGEKPASVETVVGTQ